MLRIILITDSSAASNQALSKIYALPNTTVVAAITAAEFTPKLQQEYNADLIVMDNPAASYFIETKEQQSTRKHVSSKTHQGIQMLDVANIYYFQAEHKYVIAYHNQGQLLIEDSLDSLEQDLGAIFIRIHRKILVAKHLIEQLIKEPTGQYKIKLRGVNELLMVSRRRLSQVRKLLTC